MKPTINIKKIKKISKNIIKNLSTIVRNKLQDTAFISFISRYKYILIISIIILTFVAKNLFLITKYSIDIKEYTKNVKLEQEKVQLIKDDIEYYKTDEFVYRYAMTELNMRPTKPSKLVHIPVKPKDEIKEDSKDTSDKKDDTTNKDTSDKKDNNNETTSQDE